MAIEISKDGRTKLTGKHYTEFRRWLWFQQESACLRCCALTSLHVDLEYDQSFHVSHRESRGMGGSFRDDVIGPNKGQVEGGICGRCHRFEHNQQEEVQSQPQWSRK